MIDLKTPKELGIMQAGGKILSEVLWEVMDHVQIGTSELELDALAEKLILQKGGEPGFKKVPGYKHTICVATNDVVVHGIPTDYKFKEGDVVCVDCGVFYKGFHTDMAETRSVSDQKINPSTALRKKNKEVDKFLEIGKKALEEAIKVAIVGNRIGNISKTIQDIVEKQNGYSVVRSLIGHGVGRQLHEEPEVPGYLKGTIENTPQLVEGTTIAIEVIYNRGKSEVIYANKDGWTIKSKDGSLSAVFERSVAIIKSETLILTPYVL